MASPGVRTKSATEALLDKFTEMATRRQKEMSDKEFEQAVKDSKAR